MKLIEENEVEEVLEVCAWVRRLAGTIQPALNALVERVEEVEQQCRVWEFRLYHERGDMDED